MSLDKYFEEVIESLRELEEDSTVPRNVKACVDKTLKILGSEEEISIRKDKALQQMEELANDNNMQSYTRAQIWNIVSLLESL